MKKVNMTKRFKEIYRRFCKSHNTELIHVYDRWSEEKQKAYNYCRELQQKYNGEYFRIIGACTSFFSAGFEYVNKEGKRMFVYITHGGDYEMEVL